eukprot:m.10079 g.10079  ORF g.10079 m.10079 type:complete len:378 (-) comp5525_c0_seq1:322-1455(-)
MCDVDEYLHADAVGDNAEEIAQEEEETRSRLSQSLQPHIITGCVAIPGSLFQEAREAGQALGLVTDVPVVRRDGETIKPTARPSWRTQLPSPLGYFLTGGVSNNLAFIQLSGHKGDFVAGQGVIYKRANSNERQAFEALMGDPLRAAVPLYFKPVKLWDDNDELQEFLELQDLCSSFSEPCLMDVKMGVRTFQEQEVSKTKLRPDLLQKMIKLDPSEPTEEEKEHGITKARYMMFREGLSSTCTLGFRVEAIQKNGQPAVSDFQRVREEGDVKRVLGSFLPDDRVLRATVRKKLLATMTELLSTLIESPFMKHHELIGSSLLFIYDKTGKAGVWMIDFGKTSKCDWALKHDVPWKMGTREDGYLIGFQNLFQLLLTA